MTEHLGFHKNCGGRVYRKTNSSQNMVIVCNRCTCYLTYVLEDIEQEQHPFPRRNSKGMRTAGIRKRAKKYDYRSWKDVK